MPPPFDSGAGMSAPRARSGGLERFSRAPGEGARREGRWIGIGLCNYVEGTGRGPFESASLRIARSGKAFITTGATAQGQGVKTMLAQIAGGILGIAPEDDSRRRRRHGRLPLGLGAFASRQAVNAGNAVHRAASAVAAKAIQAAAAMLNLAPEDLELANGRIRGKGMQGVELPLSEIADALNGTPGMALPGNLAPGLAASVDSSPRR